ncbi:CotY/CotZ family spore coat protein [Virgibacillus necropolis]|uniref:CotY/CotZ family spore coat protein n=1 Tax=Virgibacillus necropolis TaxID=163877 RepID=UPI0013748173|nr:CotY/CotZ family spore coat protein [Virgibacillus necropolis]
MSKSKNSKCRENVNSVKSKRYSDECVCDVVKRIVEVQDEVGGNGCSSGCDRSIHQLLSRGNQMGPANTTVPFILYCGGTCEPFIGSGVFQAPRGDNGSFFGCVETPIFRAKNFVKGSDCCVRLELLVPVTEECDPPECKMDTVSKVCPFFPADYPITDFQATGICITVDLKHFLAITCLDPITPIPANEFQPVADHDHKKY